MFLAYNTGSSGSYALSGPSTLLTGSEQVGYYGTGSFAQSGGANNIGNGSGVLYDYGSYNLSGSAALLAGMEYVGSSGAASFIQMGGVNSAGLLSIGAKGRYQFSGGTLQINGLTNQGIFDATGCVGGLNISGSSIFDFSQATLVNTGSMSVSAGPGSLKFWPANFNPKTAFAGYDDQGETYFPGSPLTILPGQSLSGNFTLGDQLLCQGTISALAGGSITLNGGVAVSGMGSVSLGNGTFSVNNSLSGITGGVLTASAGYMNSTGGSSGLFVQSAGTCTLGSLYLANNSSSGSYSLGGSGTLVASNEYVGGSGAGVFTQTAGLNSVKVLNIGNLGRYQFGGGTLQVAAISNLGVFDATGSTGALTLSGAQIADLSQAILVNTGSMSLTVGPGSLVLVSASFNPSAFGSFSNQGTLHYPGTPLVVSAGQSFSGVFTLNYSLNCQGAMTALSGGSINLNGGVSVSGTGNVNLGNGSFFAEDASSGVLGGSLAATSGYVGYAAAGKFNHSGGLINLTNGTFSGGLYLGYNPGASGVYNLSGSGVLSTINEYVGYSGGGTLNQSGGTSSTNFFGGLFVGYNAGASGVYNLSGSGNCNLGWPSALHLGYNAASSGVFNLSGSGLLSATTEYVGNSGGGTLAQTGGSNNPGTLNVGNNGGSQGLYNLSAAGLVTASTEYIGNSGYGLFVQPGGTNKVTNLYLANNAGGNGTYNLSGSGVLTASSAEYVGSSGSGTFIQTGGSNAAGLLSIGSLGRYQFSGGTLQIGGLANQGVFDATNSVGLLTVGGSAIIDFSRATLIQTGSMSVSIGPKSLFLVPAGFDPATAFRSYSSQGMTHNVGTPLSVLPAQGFAGAGSIADFVNCQGTVAAANGSIALNGGVAISGTGSVNLGSGGVSINDQPSGVSGGTLQAGTEYVGKAAASSFTQSGGYNGVSGSLSLGYSAAAFGTYYLSGQGVLSAATETVGVSGSGAFVQSGGSNTVGYLSISNLGRYQFSGGTLQLTGAGIANQGIFDATNSKGLLAVAGNSLADLSQAALVNTNSMSLTVGPSALVLLPAGVDPTTAFASFSNQGIVHVAGTPLTIAAGQRFSGAFTFSLSDFVSCQGTLSAPSGSINLNDGLAVSGSGSVNLGGGKLAVNDVLSGLSGGSLTANAEYVGNTSDGAFSHSGGTNNVNSNGALYLGYTAGVSGSYSLSRPSVLNAPYQYVGYTGSGVFTQLGGNNNSYGSLFLGFGARAVGAYNLASGSLAAAAAYVGYSGTGTFSQSGGTNNLATSSNNWLCLGYNLGSSGSYNLNGAGVLSAASESVGYYGSGTFTQSGGSNAVAGNGGIYIGTSNQSNGSYTLTGSGTVTAPLVAVGSSTGTGAFTQSGGTCNVVELDINYAASLGPPWSLGGSGTYTLGGAGLVIATREYVGSSGSASFVQTSGVNSTGDLNIGSLGRYQFNGGTLQLTGRGFAAPSSFDATGSTGLLAVADSTIVDLTQATLVNTGSMSVSVGPESLLILPAGFDPATALGGFSNQGLTHNVGTPLNVMPGQGFSGRGTIADFVSCQGSISALWKTISNGGTTILYGTDSIVLSGGISVSGTGNVNLGLRKIHRGRRPVEREWRRLGGGLRIRGILRHRHVYAHRGFAQLDQPLPRLQRRFQRHVQPRRFGRS